MELEPRPWCSGFQLVFSTKQVALSFVCHLLQKTWDNEKDEYF